MKKFFVTTPIYYPNAEPHIWQVYATLIADTLARYKRLLWYDVNFSTWIDENSQKIIQSAKKNWIDVYIFLNKMYEKYKNIRKKFNITYTKFIRTTDKNHKEIVKKILNKVYNNTEDFYKDKYSWFYCIWCEAFKKEIDLIEIKWEKVCPDHLKKPIKISENNRFFKLKNYEQKLKELYKNNTSFIIPNNKFNEVKSFVNMWLENFSISRETNDFWIKIPFDNNQVVYVRYDALLNYITASENMKYRDSETEIVHILWKDIIKFHAIYRPAMLMSANLRLPNYEIVTWFFTVDWQKISKTIWNVINANDIINNYNRDHILFYLFYDISIGSDWDFSRKRFKEIYNSMLVWWRWNLINRICKLSTKFWINEWTSHQKYIEIFNKKLWLENNSLFKMFYAWFNKNIIEEKYLNNWNLKEYLQNRYKIVQKCNEFLQINEPWKKFKNEKQKDEAIEEIKFLLYIIKNLSILTAPILPIWFEKIKEILWIDILQNINTEKNINIKINDIFDKKLFKINIKQDLIYKKLEND